MISLTVPRGFKSYSIQHTSLLGSDICYQVPFVKCIQEAMEALKNNIIKLEDLNSLF